MNRLLLIFFFFLLLQPFARAQSGNINALEARADSLFEQFDEKNALKAYKQILDKRPDYHEALWKTSFLYSRVGYRLEEEKDQESHYEKAKNLADRALRLDSTSTYSHFAMAVAMGRKAMTSGARDRLAAAKAIKKHADRAIELDSTNSGAWHVLGRWHFEVANLNFFERFAAKTLYGGIPGDATNKKAEEAVERAIKLDGRYILYYYDLAKIYRKRGKKEQAVQTCEEAMKLKSIGPDDKQYKKNCRKLIEELS